MLNNKSYIKFFSTRAQKLKTNICSNAIKKHYKKYAVIVMSIFIAINSIGIIKIGNSSMFKNYNVSYGYIAKENNYIVMSSIGEQIGDYDSLYSAVDSASNGCTIRVCNDMVENSISINKDIILDTNRKTLKVKRGIKVEAEGKLTIEGNGKIEDDSSIQALGTQ